MLLISYLINGSAAHTLADWLIALGSSIVQMGNVIDPKWVNLDYPALRLLIWPKKKHSFSL